MTKTKWYCLNSVGKERDGDRILNKITKIFSPVLISIFMLISFAPVFADSPELDKMPASWASEAVEYMSSYRLMPGGLSGYSSDIKRDEFAAVLIGVYNEACQNFQTFDNQPNPFRDTRKNPYADHIKKAYIMGLINGTSKTTFSPQKFITREDVATIIYRFIALMYPEETADAIEAIRDKDDISPYVYADPNPLEYRAKKCG
jgi:hypothetical protein